MKTSIFLKKVFFVLTVFVAVFLRFYGLGKSPISVNFDEASLGYNAYSMSKNGRDEYGELLPINLRSFNDYKPALYTYLSIPFVKVLGLNEVSTRAVSALCGVVSVVYLFYFLKLFIGDKKYFYIVWFFLSIQPWRIHFSRVALETNLSACLFFVGTYYLLLIDKKKKISNQMNYVLLSTITLALSAYSYHSARVSALGLLLLWVIDPISWLNKKKWFIQVFKNIVLYKKWFILPGILMFLVLPIFLFNDASLTMTRLRMENIFTRYSPFTPTDLIENENVWLNWRAHPIYYFLGHLSGHIFSYISPINLTTRIYHWILHSVQYIPGFVIFEWFSSVLMLLGLFYFLSRLTKNLKNRVLIYWLFCGILPAAVTWNWFHSLRSLNIYPVLEIFIAMGLIKLMASLERYRVVLLVLGMILVSSVVYIVNNELVYGAYVNNGEFQSGGFKQGVPTFMKMASNYGKAIIDTPHAQAYIFFLFYSSYDPIKFQGFSSLRPNKSAEGDQSFNFDKLEFRRIYWPEDQKLENTIFWALPNIGDGEINDSGYSMIRVRKDVENYNGATIVYK